MAIINGDDLSNNLSGFDTDDQYFGFGGFDLLFASLGNDTLDGGSDTDVAIYDVGLFTSGVFINNTENAISTVLAHTVDKRGFGTDTLIDISNFHGTEFGDTIYVGGNGGTYSFDRGGDDLVVASQEPGADGHYFLNGSGNDTLIGTDDDGDWVDYNSGPDSGGAITQGVNVDLAAGTATDGWGDTDSLFGIERAVGTSFDDTLRGDDGRNTFQGLQGNDIIDGRGGDRDRADYGQDPTGINVNLTTATATDGWGDTDTLIDIERVTGSEFDDTIIGDEGRNSFNGLNGDDSMQGLGGDDDWDISAGNDTIDGGDGFDVIGHFDAPTGVVTDLASGTTTDGFGTTDTLISIEGVDGSDFNDTLSGDEGDNFLDGRAGDDLLEGLAGQDNLRGSQGNDTIDGGGGTDRVEYHRDADSGGLAGITVDLDAGTATDGFGDNDTLIDIEDVRGTDQADVIVGNNDDNYIQALAGDDNLSGGAGRDTFEAGAGNDVIDGGESFVEFSGGDRVRYDREHEQGGTQGINVNLGTGVATDTFGDTDTLFSIEEIQGSIFDDVIVGSEAQEQLRGNDGDDLIDAGGGINNDLSGGNGNDTLTGSEVGGDFLQPGLGTDIIDGLGQTEELGEDELSYIYDSVDDGATQGIVVTFTTGGDGTVLDYGGFTDTFFNIEDVRGTNLADLFTGNDADQEFVGYGGNDTFVGGDGYDELDYFRGDNVDGIFRGIEVDMVAGTTIDRFGDTDVFSGIERIDGSDFDDIIIGNTERNNFEGNQGDDLLDSFGGSDNFLSGGRGNDTIEARGDSDFARGGDGNDLITFYGEGGGANPGLGSDTITGGTDGFFSIEYGGIGQDIVIDVELGRATIGTSGDVDIFTNIPNVGGGDGNDTLLGNDGERQEFFASLGDDFIDGRGDANDGLDGDRDWLIYNWFEDSFLDTDRAMVVDFSAGTASGVLAGNDTFVNIEAVRTSRTDDLIIGSDQAYEEYQSMEGNDTIQGGGGIDRLSYTFEDNRGGFQGVVVDLGAQTAVDTFGDTDIISGIEQVIGSDFGDTITGGAEENLISGFNGDDVVDGGAGDDRLFGGSGIDTVTGGEGADAFGGRIWELDGDNFTDFGIEDRLQVFDDDFNFIDADVTIVGDEMRIDTTGDGIADATVTLSNGYTGPVNVETGDPVAAEISIENAGLFSAVVQEAIQTVEITLNRSGDIFSTASVDVTVTGHGLNPANAADISSPFGVPQTVTFLPGETVATISVDVATDLDIEPTEDLALTLSNANADGAEGAVIDGAQTFIRVLNNDLPPQVSITGEKAQEDSGVLTFNVSRTGDTSEAITVDYEITSAGGLQGAEADDLVDGLPQSGSVVISAGSSAASFTLDIATDNLAELHDDVIATISAGTDWPAGLVVGVAQATGSIRNDDGVPPALPAGATGSNYGDPHIVTLDGLAYDFQAVGEFTLIEAVTSDPLEVQVRFQPVDGSQVASQTTAVATDLGGVRVVIDVDATSLVAVDGAAFELSSAIGGASLGDGEIYYDGEALTLVYSTGEQLRVDVFDGFLSTGVSIAENRDVRGLLGNADGDLSNDLALRDGTLLVQPVSFADLYGAFADDWRISDETSLFDYAAGQGTTDFTDSSFPIAGVTLDDFPVEVVAAAEMAGAGIEDPALKQAAILDYLVSGNTDYIEAATRVDETQDELLVQTEPTDAPGIFSGIGISVSDTEITEGDSGSQTVTFTIYRTGDLSEEVEVIYAVGGDIDNEDVSGALSGSFGFAAGEASRELILDVQGDTLAEENETMDMTFNISGNSQPVVLSSVARVTIVNDDLKLEENSPPVAQDDTFNVDEDQSLSGNVLDDNGNGIDSDPDSDALTVSLISGPSEGNLILNDDGSFTYEADADVFDIAAPSDVIDQTFVYQIDDGNGETDQATATISVSIQDDGQTIVGTNKEDTLNGTDGGEDIIYGGNANDTIFGLDGADTIYGGNLNDMLFGGESFDSLFGEKGSDQLNGEQGEDYLDGGRGNDVLRGGLDDDILIGGRGDDVFVLAIGEGTDTILDYGVGEDLIGLVGLIFDDLTIGQSGDDATISSGSEVLAILTEVDALTLDEADVFNFV